LAFSVVSLLPYQDQWRMLLQLPAKAKVVQMVQESGKYRFTRALVLSLFVVESVYPSIITGSINDDQLPRPQYHGAYSVSGHPSITGVYRHRHNYLIFENKQHDHLSLKIVDETPTELHLLDEVTQAKSNFSIRAAHHGLVTVWKGDSHNDTLFLRPLPYRKLPLLNNSFNWFSDHYH
jgi:hypothetical protein